jgi:hypothetical protein
MEKCRKKIYNQKQFKKSNKIKNNNQLMSKYKKLLKFIKIIFQHFLKSLKRRTNFSNKKMMMVGQMPLNQMLAN